MSERASERASKGLRGRVKHCVRECIKTRATPEMPRLSAAAIFDITSDTSSSSSSCCRMCKLVRAHSKERSVWIEHNQMWRDGGSKQCKQCAGIEQWA